MKKIILLVERIFVSLFFLFASFLVMFEYSQGTNSVLNLFQIDYVDTFAISLILLVVSLFRKNHKEFLFNNWKKIVFFLPVVLIFSLLIVFMRYQQIFVFLETEDSVIEWLQFLFISASSILNFVLFLHFKSKNKFMAGIFLLLTFGFFMIAGEEISWGQRIFGFQTPEEYAKVNIQQELTIHNYGLIFGYVYRIYMVFGLIASTLWTVKSLLTKVVPKILKPVTKLLIPGWQYFIYFFTAFIYNFDRFYVNLRTNEDPWEEPMELLLFIGLAIFFFELVIKKTGYFKRR